MGVTGAVLLQCTFYDAQFWILDSKGHLSTFVQVILLPAPLLTKVYRITSHQWVNMHLCMQYILEIEVSNIMTHSHTPNIWAMGSSNQKQHCKITSAVIGWAHNQNNHCKPLAVACQSTSISNGSGLYISFNIKLACRDYCWYGLRHWLCYFVL